MMSLALHSFKHTLAKAAWLAFAFVSTKLWRTDDFEIIRWSSQLTPVAWLNRQFWPVEWRWGCVWQTLIVSLTIESTLFKLKTRKCILLIFASNLTLTVIALFQCTTMATVNCDATRLQLKLTHEVLELLQQARPDATLHINALDGKGTFCYLCVLLYMYSSFLYSIS